MEELINKLSEEEKKAIEKLKWYFKDSNHLDIAKQTRIVLNLIEKQQEQLQEKDKEIESTYWKCYIEIENMSKEICLTSCKYRNEYFTKKAREV